MILYHNTNGIQCRGRKIIQITNCNSYPLSSIRNEYKILLLLINDKQKKLKRMYLRSISSNNQRFHRASRKDRNIVHKNNNHRSCLL